MKKLLITLALVLNAGIALAQEPFGWAGCLNHDGGKYELNGGKDGKTIVITNKGGDMFNTLRNAIYNYGTIVIDGSNGPLIIGKQISLENLKHKTIVGRNHAKLKTKLTLTDSIHHMLDTAKVKKYNSTAEKGVYYKLPNGRVVKEECEYQVRLHMINYLNDIKERYQQAGIFDLVNCENIIIQNLVLQGPGSVDVSGKDLLNIQSSSNHILIDHCDFIDGIDGNFDINTRADFITVSWCTFSYTDRAIMHMNTNLIGSSENAVSNGEDCLNVTFQNCIWGKGCDQRMPMVRFGKVHLLNCLYDCPGCSRTVNPRYHSEVLMEGCVWKKGVKHIFSATDATAYQFKDCIFEEKFTPQDLGTVTLPYKYKAMPAKDVETVLRGKHGAGATM